MLRDLLCRVLSPLGCEIVKAGSGEEALTELLQRKVAVIVLDINMPGMDGLRRLNWSGRQRSWPRRRSSSSPARCRKKKTCNADTTSVRSTSWSSRSHGRCCTPRSRRCWSWITRSPSCEWKLPGCTNNNFRSPGPPRFGSGRSWHSQRRERLTNIFAEASIHDLASLSTQ